MNKFNFGDRVKFNQEYRSCKPNTITINNSEIDETYKLLKENGLDQEEHLKVKEIHKFKNEKQGIYLGTKTINTSIYYQWFDSVDIGIGVIPEKYQAFKDDFIEVAEIRVKENKKNYYVPLDNLEVIYE